MNPEQALQSLENAYNHPDWAKYWDLGYSMVEVDVFPSKQSEIAYNNGRDWHLYELKTLENFESVHS